MGTIVPSICDVVASSSNTLLSRTQESHNILRDEIHGRMESSITRLELLLVHAIQGSSLEASHGMSKQAVGRLVGKPGNLESLADGLTSLDHLHDTHTISTTGRRVVDATSSGPSNMALTVGADSDCSCSARRQRYRYLNQIRWTNLEIFRDTILQHNHHSSCRYARVPGSTSRHHTLGVRLQSMLSIVSAAIEVSCSMSVGARFGLGGPNFTYYPIVDRYAAPACRLMRILF